MSFNEMINNIETATEAFDTFNENCSIYIEKVDKELEYNINQAKIKVLEESGTDSDLAFYEKEASEGALVKIINALKALIKKFKEMVEKAVKNIKDFFDSKTTKDSYKKAENVIKKNPKLKSTKINVPDYKGVKRAYDEGSNKLQKLLAKAKAGLKIGDNEAEDICKDTKDKVDKAKKVTIPLALGMAIGATITIAEVVKQNSKKDVEAVSDVEIDPTDDPEVAKSKLKIVQHLTMIKNQWYIDANAIIHNIQESIVAAVNGMKATPLPNVNGKSGKELKDDLEDEKETMKQIKNAPWRHRKSKDNDNDEFTDAFDESTRLENLLDSIINEASDEVKYNDDVNTMFKHLEDELKNGSPEGTISNVNSVNNEVDSNFKPIAGVDKVGKTAQNNESDIDIPGTVFKDSDEANEKQKINEYIDKSLEDLKK